FEHPERGLRELFRVMKPGACVLVGTWMVERSTLMEVGFELAREVLDLPNPTGDSDVEHELARAVQDCGFEGVQVISMENEVTFENTKELWTRMSESSAILGTLRERLGPERWLEQSARVQDYLRVRFDSESEPIKLTLAATLATG